MSKQKENYVREAENTTYHRAHSQNQYRVGKSLEGEKRLQRQQGKAKNKATRRHAKHEMAKLAHITLSEGLAYDGEPVEEVLLREGLDPDAWNGPPFETLSHPKRERTTNSSKESEEE